MGYEIKIIRSARKTLALEIKEPGLLLVRAPNKLSNVRIRAFLAEKEAWIEKHMAFLAQRAEKKDESSKISLDEIEQLSAEAKCVFPEMAARYAALMGVDYGRITIRNQKTRWGSCSSKGNLNFNCLLMLAPREVQEYVVVHELAHRKEMNHSPRFWSIVESVKPNYIQARKWLKEEGGKLVQLGR